MRAQAPKEERLIKRTYTLRNIDTDNGAFDIDFVVHGEAGLAGPWSTRAQVGEVMPFVGPGGKWAPDQEASRHVFVGDAAALPAIAEGIAALADTQAADAFIEVSDEAAEIELSERAGVTVHWVHRHDAVPGTRLCQAVREFGVPEASSPEAPCRWFVHGVAEMVRDLRRFLFVENGVDRSLVSVSGYWRLGMVEDEWQASKMEFNQSIEAAEAAAQPGDR